MSKDVERRRLPGSDTAHRGASVTRCSPGYRIILDFMKARESRTPWHFAWWIELLKTWFRPAIPASLLSLYNRVAGQGD